MTHFRISDMAEESKPCEKALQYGIRALTDAELLAVILRSGTRDTNVIHLAEQILTGHPIHKGLTGLNYLMTEDLMAIPGIGKVKAVQLQAVTELSRRMAREKTRHFVRMDDPETIADFFREEVRYLRKERVYALFFDSANHFLRDVMISEGSIDRSITSPREVFLEALRCGAVSFVLLHNHPSGCTNPSEADISITRLFREVGDMLGIRLLDHIIIGGSDHLSFLERGLL